MKRKSILGQETSQKSKRNKSASFNFTQSFEKSLLGSFTEPHTLIPKEFVISRYIKYTNDPLNILFQEAFKYRSRGNFETAAAIYKEALEIDPKNTKCRVNLGVCLMKLGHIKQAIQANQTASELDQTDPYAYYNKAVCHIFQTDFSEAVYEIEKFEPKISDEETKNDFLQLKSLALFRAGQVREAIDSLRNSQISLEGSVFSSTRSAKYSNFPYFVDESMKIYPKKISQTAQNVLHEFESGKPVLKPCISRPQSSYNKKYRKRMSKANSKLPCSRRSSIVVDSEYFPYKTHSRIELKKSSETPIASVKPTEDLVSFEELVKKKHTFDELIRESDAGIEKIMRETVGTEITGTEPGFYMEAVEFVENENLEIDEKRLSKLNKLKLELVKKDHKAGSEFSFDYDTFVHDSLSIESLNFLKNEFNKEPEEMNYPEICDIITKIPFFSKFSLNIRILILKRCSFIVFEAGDYIIRQGEEGANMYILISGTISILKRSKDFGNREININSLFDGETFGELALLADPTGNTVKRTASCVASEKTYVISVSKEDYKKILMNEMHHDIEGCIKFLRKMTIFSSCTEFELIPLTSNLEPIVYKVNDIILERGQIPKGLYIVFKGRCGIYWDGYSIEPKAKALCANIRIRRKRPKPFLTSSFNMYEHSNYGKTPKKEFIRQTLNFEEKKEVEEASEFLEQDVRQLRKTCDIYRDKLEFITIYEGDYFGGRSLFGTDENLDPRHEHDLLNVEPCKFTVIAESREVELLLVSRKHFGLIPEDCLRDMKTVIRSEGDIDCPYEWSKFELQNAFNNWNEYKFKLISSIRERTFRETHKEFNWTSKLF